MDSTFTVPCPPFDLTLSHWDRLFPPTHSKRILCFALAPDADRDRIVDCLHVAFHHTVQRVPFLAGSIVPFPPEQGGRPWLRNLVPRGAARLHVQDLSRELPFDDLAAAGFAQHRLRAEQLCPLPEVAYVRDDPVDVCRMQANFVDGGLLLVVSVIHIAADGSGVTEVIRIFADALRRAQAGAIGHPLEPRRDVYRSDRTLLVSGRGAPGDIRRHAAWTSSPANTHAQIANVDNACRTFRIPAEALARLKDTASTPSSSSTPTTTTAPDDWISTNDAISALVWRSIMVARHRAGLLAAGATTYVAQPLDCRAHLGLPEPYFGNVLYMTKTSLPLSALLASDEGGLAAAARTIRAEIRAMTAEKFADLVAYAERTEQECHTRLNILEDLPTGGIILTSHFRFALHELDFGPLLGGRMRALRLPATGTMAGAVIVMPRLPDGSCEFMVTERERTIECLVADPFFRRFVEGAQDPASQTTAVGALADDLRRDLAISEKPSSAETHTNGDGPNGALENGLGGDEGERNGANEVDRQSGHENGTVAASASSLAGYATRELSTLVVTDVPAPHVGAIRVVQLRRPRAKNAISRDLLDELGGEIDRLHHERSSGGVRALVLASAVDGVFCAGADLAERRCLTPAATRAFVSGLRALCGRIAGLPVPAVACVAGVALGGGLELALACHLRVFSSGAAVGLPETRLGVVPGAGGTYRLRELVGLSRALDLVLTGRRVSADEAAAMGLCNRLVRADAGGGRGGGGGGGGGGGERIAALEAGLALAREITLGAPVAVPAALAAVLWAGEAAESAAYETVLATRDRGEALLAFQEKRKPVFMGE